MWFFRYLLIRLICTISEWKGATQKGYLIYMNVNCVTEVPKRSSHRLVFILTQWAYMKIHFKKKSLSNVFVPFFVAQSHTNRKSVKLNIDWTRVFRLDIIWEYIFLVLRVCDSNGMKKLNHFTCQPQLYNFRVFNCHAKHNDEHISWQRRLTDNDIFNLR